MVFNNTLSLLYVLSLNDPIPFLMLAWKGLSRLSTKCADTLILCSLYHQQYIILSQCLLDISSPYESDLSINLSITLCNLSAKHFVMIL